MKALEKLIVSFREFARILDISETALRMRIYRGSVPKPSIRKGGKTYWLYADIEKWLKSES